MAKKVVATLQTGEGRSWSKVIKMVRSEKTGAYVFEERMVPNDKAHGPQRQGTGLAEVISSRHNHRIWACPHARFEPRAGFVMRHF